MNIREFAQEFIESVKIAVEIEEGRDYDFELASSILKYMIKSGEINAPEICFFQKTRSRITAYDYNDEAESLDLFYLIKSDTIVGKINNSRVQQGFNYLQSFYREVMDGTIQRGQNVTVNDEMSEMISLIQDTKGKVAQRRLYIITDGLIDPTCVPATIEDENDIVEFNVWDMQRVYQQHNIDIGKEKIEIDFPTSYDVEIPCLKVDEENPFVEAYIAIIPGIVLAKIYIRYHQALLERNVRTFLQFKGKVNKGIRRTLQKEPELFFSYNNGISTTASEIEIKEKGRSSFITRLYNWQIVNGGQTTASIAACFNAVDLSRVFVPMKVSVIRKTADEIELVKKISTYSNSQTAIRNSDFSISEEYLIEIERFSRNEWAKNRSNRRFKWYFERTRGQYLDQLVQLRGYDAKRFREEYPKQCKITKIDLAKYEFAWNQYPFYVCCGAEKNYELFIENVKRNKPIVTSLYYKQLIAKCILYNKIDQCVKERMLGGYKLAMDAYILSSLSFLSDKKLNLFYIWENQEVQKEVIDKIEELINPVWDILTEGLKNSGTWIRQQNCWDKLLNEVLKDIDKFRGELLQPESDLVSVNPEQELIWKAESFKPEFWFSLAQWAKLAHLDRKEALYLGRLRSENRNLTLKQALGALNIAEKAKELGFTH